MKRTKGVEPKSSYFKINQELINEGSDASSVAENNDQAPINGNQAPINGNQAPINENGGALFSAENSDDSYITARSHVSEEFKTARSYKEDNDPNEESKETPASYRPDPLRTRKLLNEESKETTAWYRAQKDIRKCEKAAAQKRNRGIQSYKETTYKNDLLSRQKIPKELEPISQITRKDHFYSRQEIVKALDSISQTTMKTWCFSEAAIYSFIHTEGSYPREAEKKFRDNYRRYTSKVGIIKYDEWRTKWFKTYPAMKNTPEYKYVGFFARNLFELATGNANCETQAIILRAYLINTLPPDILKQIGEENIMVAQYKGIDHAFVVIKRFYGKTDEPADCLVIDTYIADLYLPEIKQYRPKAAYPISHQYYKKFLKNTDGELESTMATEFPRTWFPNDQNDQEESKPYMGRMQGHFEFLRDYCKHYKQKTFPAGLKLVDRTFYYLENTVAYNNAYLLIEECQPIVNSKNQTTLKS
jgi:hypothetical protein